MPRFPNFFRGKFDAPPIREKKIIGITTAFRIETNIVPNGDIVAIIASNVSLSEPKNVLIATPAIAPSTNAKMLYQTILILESDENIY